MLHQNTPNPNHNLRVLVVDDDPDARELAAFVLESAGHEVRVAESAERALQVLHDFRPTVLVSDIGMPEVDGCELLRRVRSLPNPQLRTLPAIALTAFAARSDRVKALEAGFNLYLTKPVEPTHLVAAVRELATPTPSEPRPPTT
jgi:CheY-like chemotaxis protein